MKDDGLSLMELLVVITLLGILAAIAIPSFSHWMPDIRLRGSARDLKSDMELAKLMAIRQNAHVALTFNTANDLYTVFLDNGAGAGGVARDLIQNGTEATIKSVTMAADVDMYEASFAGGVPRFRFDARGLPNGTGGHAYMRNTKNNYIGVRVNMVGRVQIESSADGGATWNPLD